MKRNLAPFVLLQLASITSVISGSMVFIAIPWIALEITGTSTAAGLVVSLTAIPGLLLSPVLGSVIDKFGRKNMASWSELLTVLTSIMIPIFSGFWQLTLPALIGIGILRAVVAPGGSTARKSLVPDVAAAGKLTLDRANSIHEAIFASGFAIGPALDTLAMLRLRAHPAAVRIDLLNPRDSGLRHAMRILEDVKGVGVQAFKAEDVVRHAMVERIVRAYDADAARGRPAPDLEDPA